MKKLQVKAGQGFRTPRFQPFAISPRIISIDFMLSDASDYLAEQDDWYKLGGLSTSLIPDKNAAMWGIRCVHGIWELTPYLNKDKRRIHCYDVIQLQKGVAYQAQIVRADGFAVFELWRDRLIFQLPLEFNWSWFIFVRQFYAGGDSFPLNSFSLDYNLSII